MEVYHVAEHTSARGFYMCKRPTRVKDLHVYVYICMNIKYTKYIKLQYVQKLRNANYGVYKNNENKFESFYFVNFKKMELGNVECSLVLLVHFVL